MVPKHESKLSGLKVHTTPGTIDYSTANKKLSRSSSSSPDSPLDDPFSKYELHENINSIVPVPTANQKPPPSQEMERPLSPAYRIPAHVFVRNKSTAPVEWSTASNESLFSIHMGDSSFGRDSIFNYDYSYNKSPKNLNNVPDILSERKGDNDALETVKVDEKVSLTPSVSCHSVHSDSVSSVSSFAFPILTGNNGKDYSTSVGSVRIGFEYSSQQLAQTSNKKDYIPEPEPQQQLPKDSPSTYSWFGCFTCCTTCSK